MGARIIVNENDQYGVWKVLKPNVINPDTKAEGYVGKNRFSLCICTNCNETVRYIRNNELKKQANKKCLTCTVRERNSDKWPKIGEKFNLLTVIGDGGVKGSDNQHKRHYSICKCDCGRTTIASDNNLKTGSQISCGHCSCSKGEKKN